MENHTLKDKRENVNPIHAHGYFLGISVLADT